MNHPVRFHAPLAMLPLRPLREVAPFSQSTWHEIDRYQLDVLGDLNTLDRRLSEQAEADLTALHQWLSESACLPLRVHLRRSTRTLLAQKVGSSPTGPSARAMLHLLDDSLLFAMQAIRFSPRGIDQIIALWLSHYLAEDDTAKSILTELELHLGTHERGRAILIAHQGFAAPEKMTLERLGQQYGFTRERARQLEGKVVVKLGQANVLPLFALQAYRILIEAGGPLPLSLWRKRLPPGFRPRTPWELRVLRRLHDWTGMMPLTWTEHEGVEWATATNESSVELLARLARVASACREATNRFAMVPSLKPIVATDHQLAKLYLHAHPERYVRAAGGWWVSRPTETHDGAKAVRRILGTLGPLEVNELRGALKRIRVAVSTDPARRMVVPTLARLPAVLRTAGFVVDDAGMVSLGARRPGRVPKRRVLAMIEVFRAEARELSWKELIALVEARGVDHNQVGQLISRSPFVRRTGHGRYVLRGSGLAAGEDEDYREPDAPAASLTESRRLRDGTIVLAWRIDPDRGYGRHPLGEVRPGNGLYYVTLRHRNWRVLVEGDWIRGLQRLESRLRKANHRKMRVMLKPLDPEFIPIQTDPYELFSGSGRELSKQRIVL